jgi:hypothetical protein
LDLGLLCQKKGEEAQAVKEWEKALEIQKDNTRAKQLLDSYK